MTEDEKTILKEKIRKIVEKRLKDISFDVANLIDISYDENTIKIIDSVYGDKIAIMYSALVDIKFGK